ncbi:MAG TPA: hypothetical protein VJK05_06070 [archaeon]|nr:hypothetical protein [archaeon]
MNSADSRFEMVKKRHTETLMNAIKEKKADELFVPFLKKMAEKKNYFTSSSCAGRILLLAALGKGTKKEMYFHKRWHRKVKFSELWKEIENFNGEKLIFKMEAFILHLGARNFEYAEKALKLMKEAGVKKGGIIATKPGKFLIELAGTNAISLSIIDNNKILIEKDFMKYLLKEGNKKLEKNFRFLKKFEKKCLKDLE